ncbi:alpha-1,3-glucan synthase [Aspergillus saccharolyticus JOP 1030-1]|uniref:alpha-1,3-glucan synthase n=1 Tax=Aspergillus saccharolyticus JOP 1030-1 TaxID=1450539 RepID=A0A319A0V1_9EURO|nr:alpha-1,3-glucan synthase [Aspergillus saccharolyticus JOP 1030-1]PYH45918.1 alpha-1,3-glucan synthase [Aspergillus saccharolyticus JOP 1030-1]
MKGALAGRVPTSQTLFLFFLCVLPAIAWPYNASLAAYNLNENQTATNPAEYWGQWPNHTGDYFSSPDNWRFPFYTLMLDRFVNGDPTNDNHNQSIWEHDISSTQMRHGGDVAGLLDTLDYLQGMGIKGIYLAGTILMNQPWGYDGYSALDTTLLDGHYGTLTQWRQAITEIHKRGMYVVLDNTIATMGDLIGFQGYLNTTAPFTVKEHQVEWKTARRYVDFDIGNSYNETCDYPRFWYENGYPVQKTVTDSLVGCYDSDFDQYGDIEAFGVYADWKRELAKFASVQDRLREWHPSVRQRLIRHSCMIIYQLDIDGFRYDKATQSTVDALGDMSAAYRECARAVGKENFFIAGEITGGNTFGSVYLGRGRQPDQYPSSVEVAMNLTNTSLPQYFLRQEGMNAIDGAAFHYSVYRALERFLGMDGNLAAGYDVPVDFIEAWKEMVITNDLINPNTGVFDPRHMYGVTNQDVFRWPALEKGTERQLLGLFITTLLLPGIPLLLWGEEQAFYVLDATASNYIFGRQVMSPATAWQMHGCFSLDSSTYYDWPITKGRLACHDPTVSYDHRDPSHPARNIIKHMYQMRVDFPVLNDGYNLTKLSNHTEDVYYPGSSGTATETGLWSVLRDISADYQDLGSDEKNQPVWLVYHNTNRTIKYSFNCDEESTALISPFDTGTWVKNLFHPFDEHQLVSSPKKLAINGSTAYNGCLANMTMDAYEFRAYVPRDRFVKPRPMVTSFSPGHDVPVRSTVAADEDETIQIKLYFSEAMDCDSVTSAISLNSSTEVGKVPSVDSDSVSCKAATLNETGSTWAGFIPSAWVWQGNLTGVYNGIHRVTINNASNTYKNETTDAVDHFLLRVGQIDNPMIYPTANYSSSLLHQYSNGSLYVQHHAAGADKWRYSTNWGSSFSDWMDYTGGNTTITENSWSGTSKQAWKGYHVRTEYWSRWTGSSDYVQEGDTGWTHQVSRRFPHLFWEGPYNEYGYDAGLDNVIRQDTTDGLWKYHFTYEWPAYGQVSVWGMNPDGEPDEGWVMGDADNDTVLDRMPPSSLSTTVINITEHPPSPYISWKLIIDDATLKYSLSPVGHQATQIALYVLFWIVPPLSAAACAWLFMKSFYKVKFNAVGASQKQPVFSIALRRRLLKKNQTGGGEYSRLNPLMRLANKSGLLQTANPIISAAAGKRRMVLIATMEYDIEDWEIKIKIGGLGVMAQLMGKTLSHQDLIWVVPCVGGVDYPVDTPAEPMEVTIMGTVYEVQVQYHVLNNITYILLDAPVFRQQTKSDPYPARMDDLHSAVYYSAWNQCIAAACKRFPIDLYHINDYHGSLAPLYLLPATIPVCLSLHNAEFQGLWPLRTASEREEVRSVFNLSAEVVQQYVQFGEVFNLLHAGASYLRVHQHGYGAVGVSRKYGKRSYARYPIFWGLHKVGNLPNPDPSDLGEWSPEQALAAQRDDVEVDSDFEQGRAALRLQAQEWAGLEPNPDAELFVFVGRWSMQKGIDLIADIMPSILETHPAVQLICVGPVIDLYGKFAALKLDHIMKRYPGRVFSRPEFTSLPPYIFSGAEFALIPSRDEPFGLVAVEFGRKGALGVGARVGGLGQMPGWWYNVESTSTYHLLDQFKQAIDAALDSKPAVRAQMRARSAKQRFPVAQWVEDLEILQTTAIRIHKKAAKGNASGRSSTLSGLTWHESSGLNQPLHAASGLSSGLQTPLSPSRNSSYTNLNRLSEFIAKPESGERVVSGLQRKLSLGVRSGPGHQPRARRAEGPTDDLSVMDESLEEHAAVDVDPDQPQDNEYTPTSAELEAARRMQAAQQSGLTAMPSSRISSSSPLQIPTSPGTPRTSSMGEMGLLPPMGISEVNHRLSSASLLSVDMVTGQKKDFRLQKVDPFFTDSTGEYHAMFDQKLQNLTGGNSESELCIEKFLITSEKEWFERFHDAKLGRLKSPAPSIFRDDKNGASSVSITTREDRSITNRSNSHDHESEPDDEFLLGKDYRPPSGVKLWMQIRLGNWPIYSILLSLGQVIAANSYQITLLTGEVGETAVKLYGIATTYLVASICWWLIYRYYKMAVCLSLPWAFYGLAFFLIGSAHWTTNSFARGWIQNIGTGAYAVASASGSMFFALNFGDEGGAPMEVWIFRACLIQGLQTAYVIALWYWGSVLTKASSDGVSTTTDGVAGSWKMTAICYPIAVALAAVGLLLFRGLPNYYHQSPGKIASFYKAIVRRKIVLWNIVYVLLANFFLSAPYGRNWNFLWSSSHAHAWQIVILCVVFFGFVWAGFLFIVARYLKAHSWFLPLLACGLLAPRWAQIWWATSGIGYYLPWVAGGYVGGALASRSLWLWLGVLDSIQGLGFGIILLQTLTRTHMLFTLICSQVFGSIATIAARGFGPNKLGPGPISPDPTVGVSAVANAWFWVALFCQLIICAGFLLFFRKEQLAKP